MYEPKLLSVALTRITNTFQFVAITLLIAMTLLISIDVVGRYVFDRPLPGTLELVSNFAMPLMIFLTAAHCYRSGGLINIDLVPGRLKGRARTAVNFVAMGFTTLIAVVLTYSAGRHAFLAFEQGSIQSGHFEYKAWPIYAVIFLGLALMTAAVLSDLFNPSNDFQQPRALQNDEAI